ncbi:peptidase domain-containing ABC transporter [Paucibacter sp. DJ2R-2]|uniref:peptidase domain-containing ABC transporter n=1 Tax=Paucibacter sp. DJ2R-2 TaxID=2893558 RepID=UPI0021E3DDBA|nr:peptidase domain-containing ABC transporter [Paucibacter sp. DJ2R-2]MCV2420914.1 peptidase domain-containing ABC transporter [Paucibacter sp. DJ4R-1]MCV2438892.1 peptidase domain-containing ABC transporter [Paucibacter sp. DJ2R-2]
MSLMQGLQFGFGARLPMVQQTETAECGLACLAMISSYHGQWQELPDLRQRLQASAKGMTLKQLIGFADELGFAARAVQLELEDLGQLQMPCILHWDMNHFVVLRRVGARRLAVHDPAYGVRQLSLAEASRHFTGVALELSPMPSFERNEPKPAVGLGQLVGQVTGLKRSLAQVLMLSLALELLAVVTPFFQQWVLDGVIVQQDMDLLQVLALGFFLLMVLQLLISTMRSWMVIYFSTQLNLQWASGVLSKLLRLPMDYFMRRHLGDVMSRFGAIQNIRQTLTAAALNAALDGLMAGVAFAMMLVYSVQLALVTLSALLIYVLIRVLSYAPFRRANEEQIVHAARQDSHLLESVRGVQSIKLFNREDERRAHWLNLLVNTSNRELATQRLTTLYQSANALVFGVENIAVIYLGAKLVMRGELSIGMSFAYAAYKLQFSGRISALVDLAFQVRMLRIQRERLADIVLSEPELSGGSGLPAATVPDIELREVRFRYGANEPWVLDGISLRVAAGESVAIVGPSGCGKTTLLKIMLGLLTPTEGEILVMGRPLSAIGLRAWRDCLGAVMQDDQLFAGTIAENIAFGAADVDMERVRLCARMAAVDEDVLAMPMAWQTLIGDMGAAISGGQKQRLLLARALYKQPRILFLDEATSHLDAKREQEVNDSIRALQLTRVVIAHRQETIAMAGRVIELQPQKLPVLR